MFNFTGLYSTALTSLSAAGDDDDAVDGDGAGCGARVEEVDAARPRVPGAEPVRPRVRLGVVHADLVS